METAAVVIAATMIVHERVLSGSAGDGVLHGDLAPQSIGTLAERESDSDLVLIGERDRRFRPCGHDHAYRKEQKEGARQEMPDVYSPQDNHLL